MMEAKQEMMEAPVGGDETFMKNDEEGDIEDTTTDKEMGGEESTDVASNDVSTEIKSKLPLEEAVERAQEIANKRRKERQEIERKEELEREKNRILQTKALRAELEMREETNRRIAIEQIKREKLEAEKERQRQELNVQNAWRERFGPDYKVEETTDASAVQGKSGRHLVAYWCKHLMTDNSNADQAALKKCFSTIKTYINNVIKSPTNMKYRSIRKENDAFKRTIAPFEGSIQFLDSVGFKDTNDGNYSISGSPDLFLLGCAAKYIDFQLERLSTAKKE